MIRNQIFNSNLTEEEIKKINEEIKKIGNYGTIEIIKNGEVIDLVRSERIRIKNGKNAYHKG